MIKTVNGTLCVGSSEIPVHDIELNVKLTINLIEKLSAEILKATLEYKPTGPVVDSTLAGKCEEEQ